MAFFKDFLGLNYYIYDPVNIDGELSKGNLIGYDFDDQFSYADDLQSGNPNITSAVLHDPEHTMVLLNLHRNGPYGYPTWKQIRVSENHLTRRQRKSNIFTYVEEYEGKDSEFRSFIEPVVVDSYKPVSLVGEVKVYNDKTNEFQNRSVELKTSFGNETAFFANSKINDYFETIAETDDNYEQLKELYLDGGLEDEGSPIDSFNMFVYRQSIYPKQQYAYLDETRSRKYYVNTFWRNDRDDRSQLDIPSGFGPNIPSQSMWSLDSRTDFETLAAPVETSTVEYLPPPLQNLSATFKDAHHRIGGVSSSFGAAQNNSFGGEGILQNSYSHVFNGFYVSFSTAVDTPIAASFQGNGAADDTDFIMTASCYYSKRHTLKSMFSNYNPSFASLSETGNPYTSSPEGVDHSLLVLDGSASMMHTSSLFEGTANWDVPKQSGKKPFYDSYDDFATETRPKGKGFSTIPEFRISNHVEEYLSKGVTEELQSIFELSGALSENTTTSNESSFFKIISNSDFLKSFDLVKKDHKDLASEKIITLRCKGLKKFLPYKGFYPAERTVDLAKRFHESYQAGISAVEDLSSNNPASAITGSLRVQPILEPLFAPGILFNTIKSGVAVDYPIFTADDEPVVVSTSNHNCNSIIHGNAIADGTDKYPSDALGGPYQNFFWAGSKRNETANVLDSAFSTRIPFEALVEPEVYLTNLQNILQEPHPFGLCYTGSHEAPIISTWDGSGDDLYKKMANNILAEIPELFLDQGQMKTIASLEEQDPNFGNAKAGTYYTMRIKMKKSRVNQNRPLGGIRGVLVDPPQDLVTYQDRGENVSINSTNGVIKARFSTKESITMYSRPSAFGPPTWGGNGYGNYREIVFRECGSWWGTNYPYTPPYYHGEAWCDLIFYADETKKYTLDEIMSASAEFPYYTRHWWNGTLDSLRDMSGYHGANIGVDSIYSKYTNSPWADLITEVNTNITESSRLSNSLDTKSVWGSNLDIIEEINGTDYVTYAKKPPAGLTPEKSYLIQHPYYINYNAMQLDSSVNIFGKGTVKKSYNQDTGEASEVASSDTVRGKTRWIIQPKFETPILNFKKYEKLTDNDGTMPAYAQESVPRGMWHQYGEIPEDPNVGIFLQVSDVPKTWLMGALGLKNNQLGKIKPMAELVGFPKDPVRLGQVADVKEISEAVVAVPFIEKDGTRQFFSIPREDIDSCIGAAKREVEEGVFVAGGPPKAGDSVYQMVKKMQKYVFPPSMDFVRYKEIDPFAMYIFEFKHNLTKQDLADIWQNVSPEIGTRMEEAEATISHELLAHELLGGGAVVNNGVLDDNAEGNGIPSNIQWMVFKAKKRAKTNYFDKVVAKKGTTEDTSQFTLEGVSSSRVGNKAKEITYNWPYDFFSLVELVKIDAEVTFANIENDDKGQKTIKKVEKKSPVEMKKSRIATKGINLARGKGKFKK